jgi:hypothetical protein
VSKQIAIVSPEDQYVRFEPMENPLLAQLQRHCAGIVTAFELREGLMMWVNDEGVIHRLERNVLAEAIAAHEANEELVSTLHGTAVITGDADSQGHTRGLTDADRGRLREYSHVIQGLIRIPPSSTTTVEDDA